MFSGSACQVSRRWEYVVSFYGCLCGVVYVTRGGFGNGSEKEQRVGIRFCANVGKRATETLDVIQQGFGDQSLSRTQVFQWHGRFKAGRSSVDDDEHTGRATSCTNPETVARIQEIIRQDRRRTIRDIAGEVDVGYGTCQRVLTEELGMQRVAAKFVPRILTNDQMHQRVSVCTELCQLATDDETFLSRVLTGVESWVYGYDTETKRQSSQWKSPTSPRPKKARRVKSNLKIMIITFFDIKGIVHKEFIPRGQTSSSKFTSLHQFCRHITRFKFSLCTRPPIFDPVKRRLVLDC